MKKRYEVLRTFVAGIGGRVVSGVEGDVKWFEVEVAEQLERDSPGRLRELPSSIEGARGGRAGSDRMVRGGMNR